jgi:hypothetical protein
MYAAAISAARVHVRRGEKEAAIALLEPLVGEEDPEAQAELASLLEGERRAELIAGAGARYRALFEKLPEAYAMHAGNFWLRIAGDPAQALRAAKTTLEARPRREALELALLAAIALHDANEQCALAERARERGGADAKELAPLIATAAEACPSDQ